MGGLRGSPTVARPPVREAISLTGWVLQEGGFLFRRAAKSEIPLRPDGIRLNLSAASQLGLLILLMWF